MKIVRLTVSLSLFGLLSWLALQGGGRAALGQGRQDWVGPQVENIRPPSLLIPATSIDCECEDGTHAWFNYYDYVEQGITGQCYRYRRGTQIPIDTTRINCAEDSYNYEHGYYVTFCPSKIALLLTDTERRDEDLCGASFNNPACVTCVNYFDPLPR